jgi:hypothetical protein
MVTLVFKPVTLPVTARHICDVCPETAPSHVTHPCRCDFVTGCRAGNENLKRSLSTISVSISTGMVLARISLANLSAALSRWPLMAVPLQPKPGGVRNG